MAHVTLTYHSIRDHNTVEPVLIMLVRRPLAIGHRNMVS